MKGCKFLIVSPPVPEGPENVGGGGNSSVGLIVGLVMCFVEVVVIAVGVLAIFVLVRKIRADNKCGRSAQETELRELA